MSITIFVHTVWIPVTLYQCSNRPVRKVAFFAEIRSLLPHQRRAWLRMHFVLTSFTCLCYAVLPSIPPRTVVQRFMPRSRPQQKHQWRDESNLSLPSLPLPPSLHPLPSHTNNNNNNNNNNRPLRCHARMIRESALFVCPFSLSLLVPYRTIRRDMELLSGET